MKGKVKDHFVFMFKFPPQNSKIIQDPIQDLGLMWILIGNPYFYSFDIFFCWTGLICYSMGWIIDHLYWLCCSLAHWNKSTRVSCIWFIYWDAIVQKFWIAGQNHQMWAWVQTSLQPPRHSRRIARKIKCKIMSVLYQWNRHLLLVSPLSHADRWENCRIFCFYSSNNWWPGSVSNFENIVGMQQSPYIEAIYTTEK